jgi:hypothetical protein
MYFSKAKLFDYIFYQILMWFCPVNLMSLRPDLLWLISNMVLIVQCLSRFFFSILHTPEDVIAYPLR